MSEIPVRVSRRKNGEIFDENPFLPAAVLGTKTGMRRKIANETGDKFMIVNDGGEMIAPAGFHEIIEVDKTQFVKLYLNGVKQFKGLTTAGIKVFEIVFREMQNRPGSDRVHLHFNSVDQDITPISKTTFFRGLGELLEKKFVAESTVPSNYFVNIDYIFNGDRLAFVKEYRLRWEEGIAKERSDKRVEGIKRYAEEE